MNQANVKKRRARPYWHVDLKWLFGIGAVLVGAGLLFTIGLYRLTARDLAVDMATTTVAAAFSPHGLDEGSDVADFSEQLAAAPNGEFRPFPGLTVVVRESEIQGLSPRQVRLYIFRQITEPLYDHGSSAVEQLVVDPEARDVFESQLGVSSWLNAAAHRSIGFVLASLSVGFAVCIGLAVLFSRRVGRLITPAVVLLLISLGPWLFLTIVQSAQKTAPAVTPSSLGGLVTKELLPFIVLAFKPGYLWGVLAAALLFVAAIVMRSTFRFRGRGAATRAH